MEVRSIPNNNSNENYINWLSYRTVKSKFGTFTKGDPDGLILDINSDTARQAYRVTTENKKIIIYDADKGGVYKQTSRFNYILMPVRIALVAFVVAKIIVVIVLIRRLKK